MDKAEQQSQALMKSSEKMSKLQSDLLLKLAEWMNKFAVLFPSPTGQPQAVGRERMALYAENLCDMTAEALSRACSLVAKGCRFFPTVADIREYAHEVPDKRQEEKNLMAQAEAEFIRAVDFIDRGGWHPDSGLRRSSPLSDRGNTALRASGGWNRVWDARTSELEHWAKVSFCESYMRADVVGKILCDQLTFLKARGESPGQLERVGQIAERLEVNR